MIYIDSCPCMSQYCNTGVPRCIRCDRGTENVLMSEIQKAFRWYHHDNMAGESSVMVGSSPSNQVHLNELGIACTFVAGQQDINLCIILLRR